MAKTRFRSDSCKSYHDPIRILALILNKCAKLTFFLHLDIKNEKKFHI